MIIGIDASRANLHHKTGTEWYSFYLIKNLAKIDTNNKYLLYLNKAPRPDLIEAVGHNSNFSFKVLKWPFFSFWTLGRLSLEMIWHRPDILFVPAHALPLVYPRKTINTIHDLAFWRERNLYRSYKSKAHILGSRRLFSFIIRLFTFGRYHSNSVDYLYWSTSFALRHAKKIIAVSEATKDEILDIYKKNYSNKIEVIHNGYNSDLYFPGHNPEKIKKAQEEYGLGQDYFLYVGRLEKKKNTVALVEAFALFVENHPESKLNLVLVGDASFGFDQVRYTVADYNLDNRVIMPGWVKENDLPYIFSGAQAFIFPSKYEGFGIPILQALASEVPTAVSDLKVLREIAGEAVIYFDQNNKDAIYQAMLRIVNDQELRQNLIKKGREQVKKFSWEKCAREVLKLMESL